VSEARPAEVFHTIPSLRDLIPYGGKPGLTYAIVQTKNLLKAQEDQDGMIKHAGFRVSAPTGELYEVVLMAKGVADPSGDPHAGKRLLLVDTEIQDAFVPVPAKSELKSKVTKSEGTATVQL
jgi:hypothetical protein